MITITYITQLIFSGQDMHTQGSTTQCLPVVMWQYFSFRTITQLANKKQYFENNLSILIFRKLLMPNLHLYWEWVKNVLYTFWDISNNNILNSQVFFTNIFNTLVLCSFSKWIQKTFWLKSDCETKYENTMLLNKIETKALKQPNNECVWVEYMYNETQFSDVLKCDWNG